ncbi:MAG: LacI family DNA-binding transcriptional regulator [Actinomycetota bacterium]
MTSLSPPNGRGSRAPTMRDVAALAGVSVKTVSRVVNGEAGVREPLTSRVQKAVFLLDYRHNLTASSLRRSDGKTASIGLLLEDVANPFSSTLHRAIEDFARARATLVFAGSSDEDADRERELLRAFAVRRVDGLIIVPTNRNQESLGQERRLGTPLVFVDRPAGFANVDSVTSDNRGGAEDAVRHMLERGHRRIGFLGDLQTITTANERYRGYADALASAGLALDPALVRKSVTDTDAADAATMDLLASATPPTALFTGQNLITIGAVRALRRLGAQHRVALVGFDDFTLADLLEPAITVIAQEVTEMGRKAAELLFSRLDGEGGEAQHVVMQTELIERGSGEIQAP